MHWHIAIWQFIHEAKEILTYLAVILSSIHTQGGLLQTTMQNITVGAGRGPESKSTYSLEAGWCMKYPEVASKAKLSQSIVHAHLDVSDVKC